MFQLFPLHWSPKLVPQRLQQLHARHDHRPLLRHPLPVHVQEPAEKLQKAGRRFGVGG